MDLVCFTSSKHHLLTLLPRETVCYDLEVDGDFLTVLVVFPTNIVLVDPKVFASLT